MTAVHAIPWGAYDLGPTNVMIDGLTSITRHPGNEPSFVWDRLVHA